MLACIAMSVVAVQYDMHSTFMIGGGLNAYKRELRAPVGPCPGPTSRVSAPAVGVGQVSSVQPWNMPWEGAASTLQIGLQIVQFIAAP